MYIMYDTRTPLMIHVNIPSLPCYPSRAARAHACMLYDVRIHTDPLGQFSFFAATPVARATATHTDDKAHERS